MSSVIELNKLTKDYEIGFWRKRKQRALDGLTLAVEANEIFGFLGPNGAGKTTTIKILMNLTKASSGTAQILCRDISDTQAHRDIGYLPERPYFYDYLTAREFLEYCAELFGYDARTRRRLAQEKLSEVQLDERSWDKQLRRFSKGMLQRVGLAQALVNNPKVVFLDEPMSGLDPVGRREVRDLIASLPARGTTVFFCSHILSDIEALCSRAAIMNAGRLAHCGTLDSLRAKTAGDGSMEIVLAAITDAADFTAKLKELIKVNDFSQTVSLVEATPTGARVVIKDESAVSAIVRHAHTLNGKLLSVQTINGGLEKLFIKTAQQRTKDETLDD